MPDKPQDPSAPAPDRPMAFLVDGDSAPASLATEMLAEVAKFGPVVVRRVYGPGLTVEYAR